MLTHIKDIKSIKKALSIPNYTVDLLNMVSLNYDTLSKIPQRNIPDYIPLNWQKTIEITNMLPLMKRQSLFTHYDILKNPQFHQFNLKKDSFSSIWIDNQLHKIMGNDVNSNQVILITFKRSGFEGNIL
jgi:hypothetical protein